MGNKVSPAAVYAARRYLGAIRNKPKQAYAIAYLKWMRGDGLEPERPAGLSVMGAQAVRLALRDLWK